MAFGPLSLKPDELGRLTHGEFLDMVDAYKEHLRETDKADWRKLAQLAAWVTAPHVKKPVDPKKLLGTEKEKKRTTKEESNAVVMDLMKRMGEKGG